MLQVDVLIKSSYGLAKEKGWWDEPRSISSLLLLMQSEIIEALEDYRSRKGLTEIWFDGAKPCGIPVELADAAIRIADFAGHYHLELEVVDVEGTRNFEDNLADIIMMLSKAYEIYRNSAMVGLRWDPTVTFEFYLNQAFSMIVRTCENIGVDLTDVIRIKHEYNQTRPHRHGGKLI